MNACVIPTAIPALPGLIEIETSESVADTVTPVEFVIVPELALMLAVPAAAPVTRPLALTTATEEVSEAQRTDCVTSCVLPSVKVPVAANCKLLPCGIVAPTGETAIETRFGLETVNVVEAVMEAEVAEMVDVPCPEVVASP